MIQDITVSLRTLIVIKDIIVWLRTLVVIKDITVWLRTLVVIKWNLNMNDPDEISHCLLLEYKVGHVSECLGVWQLSYVCVCTVLMHCWIWLLNWHLVPGQKPHALACLPGLWPAIVCYDPVVIVSLSLHLNSCLSMVLVHCPSQPPGNLKHDNRVKPLICHVGPCSWAAWLWGLYLGYTSVRF